MIDNDGEEPMASDIEIIPSGGRKMDKLKESTVTILARYDKDKNGNSIQTKAGKLYRRFKADNGFIFEMYNDKGDMEIGQTYFVSYISCKLSNGSYYNWIDKAVKIDRGLIGVVVNKEQPVIIQPKEMLQKVNEFVEKHSEAVVVGAGKAPQKELDIADVELFKYCGHIVGIAIDLSKFTFDTDDNILEEIIRLYKKAKGSL